MFRHRFRRQVAFSLMWIAVAGLVVPSALALEAAKLTGRVLEADGVTPRTGATVVLVDGASSRVLRSDLTNAEGRFAFANGVAGRYEMLVETPLGAYLLPEPIELSPGANPPLAIRLQDAEERSLYQVNTPGAGLSPVVKWTIVGVISAAAILVIDELSSEDSETQSSGF